jgi:hypothetical protein
VTDTGISANERAVRLAAFNRVATDSVDEAADAIGRIFCPHQLKPVQRSSSDFFALHNCADFDGFSVNYVSYGGSVLIDPGCLERFFLLQIPIRGSARVQTAARDVAAGPGVRATLLSPTIPSRMTWQGDCAQIILLIERRLLEQRGAALSGRAGRRRRIRTGGRTHQRHRSQASGADPVSHRSGRAYRTSQKPGTHRGRRPAREPAWQFPARDAS